MGSICLVLAALIQHLKNQCLKSILPDEVLIEFQSLGMVGRGLLLKIKSQSPQKSNFVLCKMLKEPFLLRDNVEGWVSAVWDGAQHHHILCQILLSLVIQNCWWFHERVVTKGHSWAMCLCFPSCNFWFIWLSHKEILQNTNF